MFCFFKVENNSMFRFGLSTNKNQFKISDDVEKYIKQSHADFLRKLETRVLSYERNKRVVKFL